MVVLGLVGMLAAGVLGFLWDLWGRRDVLLRNSRDAQAGSAVVERMETDILGGMAGDQAAGAGIAGTATTLKVLTRGVDVPLNGQGSTTGDLQASEYQFESGVLQARRWNIGGAAPEMEVVCDHVEAVRLRYFDGKAWKGSFDSLSAGGLPVAVEVALWFGTPRASDQSASKPVGRRAGTSSGRDAKTGAFEPADEANAGVPAADGTLPSRQPDCLRVIVVPDGPVASWKETP